MVLWVDKHRPLTLDKMQIHLDVSKQLKNIVASGDFPHLLIYGPSGAGKKTRIQALLREIYGSKIDKVKLENKDVAVGSDESKTITVTALSSGFHVEFTPSDSGYYDRYVVANMIKEIAETESMDFQASSSSSATNLKVIVLHEVDNMTREAQQALRRIMEKYAKSCRMILCANSTSKIIPPIRSRCMGIRVAAPENEEIKEVLRFVAKKESIKLIDTIENQIVEKCDGNLRRAILMLESAKVEKYPFTKDQEVKLPGWERFVEDIAKSIIEEQSPQKLLKIRDDFFLLLTNCIAPETILKTLLSKLLGFMDGDQAHKVISLAALYEHRMKCGSKPIFHLEAFVAKVMTLCQNMFTF